MKEPAKGEYAEFVKEHVALGGKAGEALAPLLQADLDRSHVRGLREDAGRGEVDRPAGLGLADVDWVVPHQANRRILDATARKLGLPAGKMVVTVDEHANTSAASVPLAYDAAVRDGTMPPMMIPASTARLVPASTRPVPPSTS